MLLSLPALSRDGFSANARGCRQYLEALELLSSLGRAHELPHLVVIALGANGTIEEGDIRRALAILGSDRLLVLLTPRQLGGGSGPNAQLVRAEARRHPDQVVALDWVAYSAGHPSWFQPDGLHLTLTGAAAFASLIARVLPLASAPRWTLASGRGTPKWNTSSPIGQPAQGGPSALSSARSPALAPRFAIARSSSARASYGAKKPAIITRTCSVFTGVAHDMECAVS
jgi:hypothetical protein